VQQKRKEDASVSMLLDSISDASSPNQTKFTAEGLGLGLWAYLGGTSKGIMEVHVNIVSQISRPGFGYQL